MNVTDRIKNRLRRRATKDLNGTMFAKAFNILRTSNTPTPLRLTYNKNLNVYTAQEGKDNPPLFFTSKQRAELYKNGISKRLSQIYSEYLVNAVSLSNDDLVLDVGANIGEFGMALLARHSSVRYVAFEPSPKCFRCLKENVPFGDLHNIALSNTRGHAELFICDEFADTGLLPPAYYTEKTEVCTDTLDNFIREPVKLLKLEAEGFEQEVLEGALSKLKQVAFITADLGPERGNSSSLPQVTHMLLELGFEFVDVTWPRMIGLYKNRNFHSS